LFRIEQHSVAHIRAHVAGAGFSKGLVGDETGLEAGMEATWKLP